MPDAFRWVVVTLFLVVTILFVGIALTGLYRDGEDKQQTQITDLRQQVTELQQRVDALTLKLAKQ